MKTKTYSRTVAEVPDVGDLDISPFSNLDESVFEPEFHINQANPNEAVLLFTQHDEYTENPLDECDGLGKIHHHPRSNYGKRDDNGYYDALGLNSYGDKNLDAIFDRHFAVVCATYQDNVLSNLDKADLVAWADECYEHVEEDEVNDDTCFVRSALTSDLKEYGFNCRYGDNLVEVLGQLFDNPKYFPGDNCVQLLDVYDHGMRSYSLSGSGMQCRWDTSNGEAIWVPDDCAREEIKRRAKVYQFGQVIQLHSPKYYPTLDSAPIGYPAPGGGGYPGFEHWHEAFTYLEKLVEPLRTTCEVTDDMRNLGIYRAAREVAKSCVAEYDAWQRGDNHYQVCIQYAKDGEGWEQVDYDTCGGFIGSEYAEESRYECAPAWVSEQINAAQEVQSHV